MLNEIKDKTGSWLLIALALGLAVSFSGCGDEDDDEDEADKSPISVTLNLKGQVGDADFACSAFEGLGTASSTLTPSDFRFYLYDVRLLDAQGNETPLTLEQDGAWQVDDVVLVDFEDKSGTCSNGTTQTNTVIKGTAPAGDYTGVRFGLGIPFDLNHNDANIAPSPLNLSGMFWSWNGGYKFLRIDDATTGGSGFRVHLGSTGCEGEDNNVTACAAGNRPEITLNDFNLESSVIVADIAALLSGSDLSTNTPDTPPGCMSAPNDPDCDPIFSRLGLKDEEQSFFRVE